MLEMIACAASPALASLLYSCPAAGEPWPIRVNTPIIIEARYIPTPEPHPDEFINPIVTIPPLPEEDIALPVLDATFAFSLFVSATGIETEPYADNQLWEAGYWPAPERRKEARVAPLPQPEIARRVALDPFGGIGPDIPNAMIFENEPATSPEPLAKKEPAPEEPSEAKTLKPDAWLARFMR